MGVNIVYIIKMVFVLTMIILYYNNFFMRYVKKSGNLTIEVDGVKEVINCPFDNNTWAMYVNAKRAISVFGKKLITKMMAHLGFTVRSIVINIES